MAYIRHSLVKMDACYPSCRMAFLLPLPSSSDEVQMKKTHGSTFSTTGSFPVIPGPGCRPCCRHPHSFFKVRARIPIEELSLVTLVIIN